jgi:hypothetical protein
MEAEDKGRALTEQMYSLVGRAINQWSFLEENLCHIFMVCTGGVIADPEGGMDYSGCGAVADAFYSVENFRGKLALIDAALVEAAPNHFAWGEEVQEEWARLREKARKLSLRRNRIAHCTILPGYDYQTTIPPRLVPPIGSRGYYRATGLSPAKHRLTVEQVRHLERAFCLLSEKLRDFTYRFARQEGLFDRYVERVALQIDSYSRRDPTRAERLKRALPSPE